MLVVSLFTVDWKEFHVKFKDKLVVKKNKPRIVIATTQRHMIK